MVSALNPLKELHPLVECVDPIRQAGIDRLLPPLFNALADDAPIAGTLSPTPEQIPQLLEGWSGPRPLLVCSGGTSSRCAAAGHWSLDLRAGCRTLQLSADGGTIRIGAGHRMGEVLDHLASRDLTIPAGLSGWPGLGFVLTGGMGPLTRRHGLAIDRLLQIRGAWGNGEPLVLTRSDDLRWRALCGAAPFLAVVTEVTMETIPLEPLWIKQRRIAPELLPEQISVAEQSSLDVSLQWHWGEHDQLRLLWVKQTPCSESVRIEGLHQLPSLAAPLKPTTRVHAEVVGLLGPAAASGWGDLLPRLRALMQTRPHPACSLACQQLGGASAQPGVEGTAFVHRDAVWKPWITAAWSSGDEQGRLNSLEWLETVWSVLRPICPGVHLAQLHHHLPWHRLEVDLAFGDRLNELQRLKTVVDPDGNLPSL